jgi:hypothetical protein
VIVIPPVMSSIITEVEEKIHVRLLPMWLIDCLFLSYVLNTNFAILQAGSIGLPMIHIITLLFVIIHTFSTCPLFYQFSDTNTS